MLPDKKRYKALIADQSYTIIGNESKEHMDTVTEVANHQLAEIFKLSPQTDLQQGSVLLAINALSDQLKKQELILTYEQELVQLRETAKKVEELENRLQRIENLEQKAKEVLKENGSEKTNLTPYEAQQIINQQVKEKIQQNHLERK